MKFLTEDDIRVEYHNVPFDTFTIPQNVRLTPGARTFLADRRIKIIEGNGQIQKKASKIAFPVKKEEPIQSITLPQAEWFAIRCELLKTAYDLASTDLLLVEELKIIERCLALALVNEKGNLPPITMVNTEAVQMDKATIVEHLSTVGMFLQTNKGRVLTRLYPLYFRLEAWIEQVDIRAQPYLSDIVHRLEQLIAYYLNKGEEGK